MEMKLTFNFDKVINKLNSKKEKMNNMKPVLERISKDMKKESNLNFRNERTPDGRMWTPLADSTIKRRRKKSKKPLKDTGKLKNSISAKADETRAVVGTNLKYAAIHQFGGFINKKASTKTMYWKYNKTRNSLKMSKKKSSNFATDHKVKAYQFYIPARPYLGINDSMMARYRKMITDYVKK